MAKRRYKNCYIDCYRHLQLRGRRWSYRRAVPADLRGRLGCREVVRALGTESLSEAERFAAALDARVGQVFATARSDAEIDAGVVIARLVDHCVAGMAVADRFRERRQSPLGGDYLAVCCAFEACGGRLSAFPQLPQEVQLVAPRAVEPDAGRKLGKLVELYIKEREGAGAWTSPRAAQERKRELGRLTDALGEDAPLAQLDKEKMIGLRDQLGEGKSTATVEKLMGNVIALLTFGVDAGWMPSNPARGLRPRIRTRVDKLRDAFTDEELARLFAPQLVRESLERGRPERYWLPLLALYTGARLEELAQLEVWDVREIDGVPCLDITDKPNAPDGKTEKTVLKTHTSDRAVPLHSHLVELGFLDFVGEVRGERYRRVFHRLNRGSDRGFGPPVSLWFGAYRKRVGVDAKGKVFHSFRHTVPTRLKAARGVEQTEIAELLGHAVPGMSVGRYGKRLDPKAMRTVVELLDFRAPLAHLFKMGETDVTR